MLDPSPSRLLAHSKRLSLIPNSFSFGCDHTPSDILTASADSTIIITTATILSTTSKAQVFVIVLSPPPTSSVVLKPSFDAYNGSPFLPHRHHLRCNCSFVIQLYVCVWFDCVLEYTNPRHRLSGLVSHNSDTALSVGKVGLLTVTAPAMFSINILYVVYGT